MSLAFHVVIPARYAATRLPGKPLRLLAGQPLIAHVIARAQASAACGVVVATDDARIREVAMAHGAEVAMTATTHRSGSERIAEVIAQRGWPDHTLIVNVQGDEPGLAPELIDQVAANLAARPELGMATLAVPLASAAELRDPHLVKVVCDAAGHALYFSRAPIPWSRDLAVETAMAQATPACFLRHLGLYAYRAGFLRRYVTWPPAPLEELESLEQLRVLWQGERMHVGLARALPGPGVDTPADLARAEAFLRASGTDADRDERA